MNYNILTISNVSLKPTTMKTQTIIQDYYGALSYINQNNDKELIIFIIDDNPIYRQLMKQTLDSPCFSVLTFSTGEEGLDYLHLNPDIILLDYHLDGINPNAQKGDTIYRLIKEVCPKTEVFIISSDEKFKWFSDLNLKQKNKLVYKDSFIYRKIKTNVIAYLGKKDKQASYLKFRNYSLLAISFVFLSIYTILFLT